jgi:hypothetical protein
MPVAILLKEGDARISSSSFSERADKQRHL